VELSIEDPAFGEWLAALEMRHLANMRVQEVTRALRALSSAYVARRPNVALESAGKRAAFALFYAPLHFLITRFAVQHLAAQAPAPQTILDLGCGTGAAGAAWSIETGRAARVAGIDRHRWAAEEARWTYRQLRLWGQSRHGDLNRLPRLLPGTAVIVAYVLNELDEQSRVRLLEKLADAAAHSVQILIVEPIARGVTPWWDDALKIFDGVEARSDEWRLPIELPPLLAMFDKAAGLEHRDLTARTLYCAGLPTR
jgi:hypothetical protein